MPYKPSSQGDELVSTPSLRNWPSEPDPIPIAHVDVTDPTGWELLTSGTGELMFSQSLIWITCGDFAAGQYPALGSQYELSFFFEASGKRLKIAEMDLLASGERSTFQCSSPAYVSLIQAVLRSANGTSGE